MISRLKNFEVFIKDKNKKKPWIIFKELLHFAYLKKDLPVDYFRKFLYRKEITDYTSYLSKKQYYSIIDSPKILIPEIALLLDNKLSFALHAEKQALPVPKLISYNVNNSFFFNSEVYRINNKTDLIAFFNMVFLETKKESLFLKPINGIGGKGCILIEKETLKVQILNYEDTLLNNIYIHQEKIKQHPVINKMHAHAVNTIRVNTYMDVQGQIHVLSVLMRFGIGTSITDNISSGGFYVSVDMESGTLVGLGFQEVDRGGSLYTQHPDSKIVFENFKIPFLKEALELAKLAALKTPTRIIGWDIAVSDSGPLIVEGNTNPCLSMADIAYGGLCKQPIIQTILKEVNT